MGACLCCEPRPPKKAIYEKVTTEVPNKDYKERQMAIKTLENLSFI